IIKAKAVVTGPKTVGTIDLNPRKPEPEPTAPAPAEKPAAKTPEPPAEKPAAAATPDRTQPAEFQTQYRKLTGPTLTSQTIDLSQVEKAKKKKEAPRVAKPGAPGTGAAGAGDSSKGKRKRILKPGTATGSGGQRPGGPGAKGGAARPGFGKGRPAIVAKVEPTEEEVKNQI